jgi:aldehyde:ferredoxin oxidoreductase
MNRYGWAGHMLRVDLSSGKIRKEESDSYVDEFVGGRGLGQNLLFRELAPGVGALDPRNPLILAAGPLTGTLAPGSGRLSISGKNLLTGGIGSSNVGGHFGPELKYAGFDAVVIEGKSAEPVYLLIEDGKATLYDARHLRGKTTWETEEEVRRAHGRTARILSIGPAGERSAPVACIIADRARAAGRCGFGAVMGSKNLKAIVARGSLPVEVADPEGFMALAEKARAQIFSTATIQRLRTHGTCGSVGRANASCTIPFRNFQDDHMDEKKLERVARPVFQESYQVRNLSCMGCFFQDTFLYESKEGEYAPLRVEGFQQNLVWDFVGKLEITDPGAVLAIQALCSKLGLDMDNTSGAIALAFELFEKGIIGEKETEGLRLDWGDHRAVIRLMEKMAYGEGIGSILNQGGYRAAKAIGKGAEKYAVHIKGQDLAEAIRADKGWALGTVVAPRGGGHLNGATMTGMMRISPEESMAVFGTPYGGEQDTYRGKAKVVYWYELFKSAVDTVGLCYFPSKWVDLRFLGPAEYAELLSAATGKNFSGDDLMILGRKVHNIEKAFNTLHAGFGAEDDYPPGRFFEEPVKSGPYEGALFTRGEWQSMLEEYYRLHGWDPKTGLQTEEILKELGLGFVREKLTKAGKIRRSP